MVATTHGWILSTWNMATATKEKQNFKLYLILNKVKLNSHMVTVLKREATDNIF